MCLTLFILRVKCVSVRNGGLLYQFVQDDRFGERPNRLLPKRVWWRWQLDWEYMRISFKHRHEGAGFSELPGSSLRELVLEYGSEFLYVSTLFQAKNLHLLFLVLVCDTVHLGSMRLFFRRLFFGRLLLLGQHLLLCWSLLHCWC